MYSPLLDFAPDDLNPIDQMGPHIFIGGLEARTRLTKHNIHHVISLFEDSLSRAERPDGIQVYETQYTLNDDESTVITHLLDPIESYVANCIQRKENVLIHCRMGISRSASIILGLMMAHPDWFGINEKFINLDMALEHAQSIRPYIDPNPAFMSQLRDYEDSLIKQLEINLY